MPKVVNLIGETFGKLKVIAKAETKCTGGKTMYICQCECNKIITVRGTNLTTFRTQSCGCEKESIGEQNIIKILIENGITVARQLRFPDCKDKNPLPFDVAVMNDKDVLVYIIEFDGKQHFEPLETFGGEKVHEDTKRHDKIKNEYCKAKNIPLIRIPYTERDKMTLEMLNPKTSRYLI